MGVVQPIFDSRQGSAFQPLTGCEVRLLLWGCKTIPHGAHSGTKATTLQ
jgi:hypothetical protein